MFPFDDLFLTFNNISGDNSERLLCVEVADLFSPRSFESRSEERVPVPDPRRFSSDFNLVKADPSFPDPRRFSSDRVPDPSSFTNETTGALFDIFGGVFFFPLPPPPLVLVEETTEDAAASRQRGLVRFFDLADDDAFEEGAAVVS